jgi:uncharacterized protein (TIGR02001 family)
VRLLIALKLLTIMMVACGLFAFSTRSALGQPAEKWNAPFGGTFNANFTVASDYSYAGISNAGRGPAFQMGLDYRTPDLMKDPPLWLYLSAWGSNTKEPAGSGVEMDLLGGVKFRLFDRRLKVDLGYVRVTYPGFPPELGYDYGDFSLSLDYELEWATLSARIRASPNSFGNSGKSWNKRGMAAVPLTFLPLGDDVKLKAYAAIGNLWVERPLQYGIPSNEYWYWQFGVVASAFGLDMTLAYTDTNIEPVGCGNTNYCAGQVFIALTKVF